MAIDDESSLRGGAMIQRSSYHDVIRVSEIQKVLDISGVQTYIINSARVVFLNERPQPRPGKGVTNTCERSLLDTFCFCSLGCKIVRTFGDFRIRKKHAIVAKKKREKKHALPPPQQQQQHRGAADSEDDDDDSSTSTSGDSDKRSVVQSFTPSTPPATTANSFRAGKRRKGMPHRSLFGSLVVEF
ncbi:hypothetical protein Zm00014a_014714 [Zea mays]|uniref:Uncharacterized protein n=1 Tax=Zea mays TaxID=4577 RepID=A0A3L6DRR2_MAIZE|nr:hypothetical protein Zm00014a_014714 [Zea mays]